MFLIYNSIQCWKCFNYLRLKLFYFILLMLYKNKYNKIIKKFNRLGWCRVPYYKLWADPCTWCTRNSVVLDKKMVAPVLSVTVTPTKCVTSLPPPLFFSSTSRSRRCLSLSSVRFKRFFAPVIEKAEERVVAQQPPKHICRAAAAEYKFPDPIPEFADAVSPASF